MRLAIYLLLFLPCSLFAQIDQYERLPLPQRAGPIASPQDFLGYRLGERFTEYARSVEYFRMLAEASDRIQLEQYGETYEKRPLILLTISDVANMNKLEDIRQNQLRLVGASKG
ncbi:MAG: peptidase M14, partial [Bacteroidota bacterium]